MLCAVASVNIEATVAALQHALSIADFGDCVLFTDAAPNVGNSGIRVVPIRRIPSSSEYSRFVLCELVDYVTRPHCLLVQWDGFPIHPDHWTDAFLACDYIGAPWPQFSDGHDVGNGGFSLRSRKLMEACRAPEMEFGHPEDVVICRTNRNALEQRGMRFAEASLAAQFSCERSGYPHSTFGFHGVFRMVEVLGFVDFIELYNSLDERSSVWRDLKMIVSQLRADGAGWDIALRMWCDRLRSFWRDKWRDVTQ